MTAVEIKEAVRERDSHRCRDCGITQEQYGRWKLDVHRLVPGRETRTA